MSDIHGVIEQRYEEYLESIEGQKNPEPFNPDDGPEPDLDLIAEQQHEEWLDSQAIEEDKE